MKHRFLPLLLLLCLLAGCGSSVPAQTEDNTLTILCTTYPIYLFASAVTDGVEGVTVERLDTGSVSCLHDYTLSVTDMKKIEGADVIALNGGGLEDFMDDALAASNAIVIDCSQSVELLENVGHDHEEGDKDHDHWDPHYWMSTVNATLVVSTLMDKLGQLLPDQERTIWNNGQSAMDALELCDSQINQVLSALEEQGGEITGLITFHEGFQYFANAYRMPLLAAIEEEAGSEASAKEIVEITQLVKEYSLPVIFTEVNGSDATANAIARETGCQVAQLTMVMDGPDDSLDNYLDGLMNNIKTIVNAFAGEEIAA
jgi:ABC-type Zn uptake system ZnuABC Zn-binding protein ZnuA